MKEERKIEAMIAKLEKLDQKKAEEAKIVLKEMKEQRIAFEKRIEKREKTHTTQGNALKYCPGQHNQHLMTSKVSALRCSH